MVAVYGPFICMFCCLFANDNYPLLWPKFSNFIVVCLHVLQFSHVNCTSDMLKQSDLFLITTKKLIDPFSSIYNWLRWWMMLEIIST